MTSAGGENLLSGSPLPTRIRLPPSGFVVSPPPATRPETLPLPELPWPDVERLLLRLAERELGQVESGGLYGTSGQSQEGIDLYIRHSLDKVGESTSPRRRYSTLQSRRVRSLSAAKIKTAVNDFLNGSWADRSRTFIYATTHSLKKTQIVDELNRQADRLEKIGITLLPWGVERISELLRSHPAIIDDFFGRAWVHVFCGPDAAEALGTRLPARDVVELRRKLAVLYHAVFSTQDTGFALLPSPDPAATLDARFVLLDVAPDVNGGILEPTSAGGYRLEDEAVTPIDDPVSVVAEHTRTRYARVRSHRTIGEILRRRRIASDVSWVDIPDAVRTPADDWIAQGDLAVVSGPPGSGKSTLLRHIIADLLSETPTSQSLAQRFADRLPIWLPFAFLCSHLTEGTDRSIPSAARAWLTQQSAVDLCELVDRALMDDRLLLVVDGLDEWSDPHAAGHAFGLLEAFVGGRAVASIMSSRPYALRRLPTLAGWRVGRLAPLTEQQRRVLATIAFRNTGHTTSRDSETAPVPSTDGEARRAGLVTQFLTQLDGLPDLQELAGVPLFLLLLAGVWSGEPIPTRRFTAYSRLVDLLLERHPAIRRRAAPTPSPVMRFEDLRRVFAYAAYQLRCIEPSLIVPTPKLRNILIDAMTDEDILAVDPAAARALADRVMDVAEDELGIIVKHGAGTVGFLHRVIAEQLAAEHLATLPLAAQRAVVNDRVWDRAWRDVLLATLMLQSRPSDVAALLDAAVDQPDRSLGQLAGYEFMADALAAGARISPRKANELAEIVMGRITAHPWLAHRARLLVSLTSALAVPALTPSLREAFSQWVPARVAEPAAALSTLSDATIMTDDAAALLLWGLRHPDKNVRRTAAEAAARRFRGSEVMLSELSALARIAASAEIQAAALMALVQGWPGRGETHAAVTWAREQTVPVLRLVALHAVHQQTSSPATSTAPYSPWTESERQWLLGQLDRERMAEPLWWNVDATLVAAAAAGDQAVREHCIDLLRGNGAYSDGNFTLAWSVVTAAFPHDPEVTAWAAQKLGTERVFPGMYGVGPEQKWLSSEPDIVAAVEARLASSERDGLPQERPLLARLAPSSTVTRDWLVKALAAWAPWIAASALLELFGDDRVAQQALWSTLTGPAEQAAPLAYYAGDILGLAAAVSRLREVVEANPKDVHIAAGALARTWHLVDRIARGTADPQPGCSRGTAQAVLRQHPAGELMALCLGALPEHDEQVHDDWIMVAWPDAPEVADRAEMALQRRQPRVAAVLEAYGRRSDPTARELTAAATRLLGYLEPELRTLAAQQLGRPGVDPQLVVDLLQDWTRDPDPDPRRAAAVTLTQVLATRRPGIGVAPQEFEPFGDALDRLRSTCREELQAKGSQDNDMRRRIAWTVMLLLAEPELLDGLNESYGDRSPVGVELVPIFEGVDHTLTTLIARNWETLTARLGPSLITRLDRRASEETAGHSVWAAMATVATHYPAVEASLREQIEHDPSLLNEDLVLAWYARSNPGDPEVATTLFALIDAHQSNDKPVAITLLQQLASADQIRAWLSAHEANRRYLPGGGQPPIDHVLGEWQRVVLAQCLPDDPRVSELYECLQREVASREASRWWSWPDAIAVTFAAAPGADLPALFLRILATLQARGGEYFGPQLLDAVARRLSRDPMARTHWSEAVAAPLVLVAGGLFAGRENMLDTANQATTAKNRQVLFASVLAAAGGIPPELAITLSEVYDATDPDPPVLWQSAIGDDRSTELVKLEILDTAL